MNNLKRLIKSEFYDGVNKYNTYIEIFKNPTSQEIEDTMKNDSYKCVRGLLYKDGTVYIWPADILHGSMNIENETLDFTQYRFFTGGKDWLNFHTDKGFIDYKELKNAMKIAESTLRNIVNLDSSYIEIVGLDDPKYNGKVFQGNYEKFLNLYEDVTKVGRLIKSIDFNKRNINITPNENKTCPADMPPQFDLKIKENLIPLNQLNEADVKTDRCPRCKYHPLEKKDGFKTCLRCNSTYKMLDGKGYLIN